MNREDFVTHYKMREADVEKAEDFHILNPNNCDEEAVFLLLKGAIDEFYVKYRIRPNVIKLGAMYAQAIQHEALLIAYDKAITVMGIPVELDFANPQRIGVGLIENI